MSSSLASHPLSERTLSAVSIAETTSFEAESSEEENAEIDFIHPTSILLAEKITLTDSPDHQHWLGERIDKIAAQIFHDYSREQIKDWLDTGELTVNGTPQRPKYRLKHGDTLALNATLQPQQVDIAEDIPLDIIYEDEAVLVINKPADMVVHPGAGNPTGTLVNALLFHYPDSRLLPRAGLVHRIDKQTTGLMVIAKDTQSQLHLINQLKDKSVYRHYQALVLANPTELLNHTHINAPIARHPTQRTKMAVVATGKPAVTHIQKISPIREGVSLVSVRLETGRTHQIRVHLSHLGFSLVGDPLYGNARKLQILLNSLDNEQQLAVKKFQRQALHAYELGFVHPKTGEAMRFSTPLPKDMQDLIGILKD